MGAIRGTTAQQLRDARLMADGIKKRLSALAKSDLDEAWADGLEKFAAEIEAADSEQEELKALLKAKTAALADLQAALADRLALSKKAVKYFVDKNDWKTFGIEDKK